MGRGRGSGAIAGGQQCLRTGPVSRLPSIRVSLWKKRVDARGGGRIESRRIEEDAFIYFTLEVRAENLLRISNNLSRQYRRRFVEFVVCLLWIPTVGLHSENRTIFGMRFKMKNSAWIHILSAADHPCVVESGAPINNVILSTPAEAAPATRSNKNKCKSFQLLFSPPPLPQTGWVLQRCKISTQYYKYSS